MNAVDIYNRFAFGFAMSSVILVADLFIGFRFKGAVRNVSEMLVLIPLFGFFVIGTGTDLISLVSEGKRLPSVVTVAGLLILCVSWMMSVAFETNSDVG